MFLHFSLLSFLFGVLILVVYYRHRLFAAASPYLPTPLVARLSNYTPLSTFTFSDQAASGLSSGSFDLEENNGEGSGETRMGLDQGGVEEVRRIMAIERCTFDRARLIRHNRLLAKNGIAPDGTPLDRKAITHL